MEKYATNRLLHLFCIQVDLNLKYHNVFIGRIKRHNSNTA